MRADEARAEADRGEGRRSRAATAAPAEAEGLEEVPPRGSGVWDREYCDGVVNMYGSYLMGLVSALDTAGSNPCNRSWECDNLRLWG